jgi:uncharacterized protein (TIGR03437 family)
MRLLISLFILVTPVYCADFTTYIGGSANAIATDAAGDTYVAGNGSITKLDAAGNIVFSNTTFGGNAITVDPSGNIWVGGFANSQNFPLVNPLQSMPGSLNYSAGILVKMAPDGTVLYSSYFGGVLGDTGINGIATDQNGNVYVTGSTNASDFPTTVGLPASPLNASAATPVSGAFATKLNSTGQKIIYSTVIAGTVLDADCVFCNSPTTQGLGIAVDAAGNAIVAGDSDTTDLPVTNGATAGSGAFAFKINAAGSALVYLTYLGPAENVVNDVATSTSVGTQPVAADASGNAYIVGNTNSPDFQGTPGTYQSTGGGDFAMKLNPEGAIVWLTFAPVASAVSLDSSDNLWLAGGNTLDELSPDGSALLSSTQFPSNRAQQYMAIDSSGVIHVTDSTGLISTIAPGNLPAPRVLAILNAAGGIGQVTTGLIAPGEIISLYGSGLGPANPVVATPGNGLFPTSLGGVQVLVNGTPIPLLYVSVSQINAEIPSPLSGTANGIVQVQVMNSAPLPDFRLTAVSSDFAVFRNESASMVVINQDGTVNKIANPAKVGSVVSIWATGFGATGPKVNGSVPTAANNYCSTCQLTLTVGETSVTESVQYAGTSPGLIDGLMQINFLIPAELMFNGAWVYFTPPGATQPLMLGWVDTTQ